MYNIFFKNMAKLSIQKTTFTTKQVCVIVLVIVAITSSIGTDSFKDFFSKFIAFGLAAELVVILFATFLTEQPKK